MSIERLNPDKIYFDMDGVLCDFSLGLKEICRIEPPDQNVSSKEQDDAMWLAIRNADHFYLHLKEIDIGVSMFRDLVSVYGKDTVEILSAVPKKKRGVITAEEDKRLWVREHLGEDITVNIVYDASDKKSFAKEGRILFDDLEKNIEAFECYGGTGILFDAEWIRRNNPKADFE